VILERTAHETITAVELDHGDELRFTLRSGDVTTIKLVSTRATVDSTSVPYPLAGRTERPDLIKPWTLETNFAARIVLRMHCTLLVNDRHVELVRWVGNQRSFYEPWIVGGVRLWFDAADALFEWLSENHGACRPRKAARFALQDVTLRICPPLLHPWCPLPSESLRIADAYAGSDCWMGPYAGADAHGGLDVNHPAGTPIWAPFSLDSQGIFESLADGDSNNRWRGRRTWPDGTTWIIQTHHVIEALAPDGEPTEAGIQIATGAGVAVGAYEHSHFTFGIIEPGESYDEIIRLDPWILFWQMYRDRRHSRSEA
jgi:hypothetical protein